MGGEGGVVFLMFEVGDEFSFDFFCFLLKIWVNYSLNNKRVLKVDGNRCAN